MDTWRPPTTRGLAPVPLARGEAEDFALDAASLECAREDLDSQGRDEHGPATHRSRVIDEQGHDGGGEGRLAFFLEGLCPATAGDEWPEARGVEQPFLEVETPVPGLPGHEHSEQPLGESGDHGAHAAQLRFELRAQLRELLTAGEPGRVHYPIVGRCKYPVGAVVGA